MAMNINKKRPANQYRGDATLSMGSFFGTYGSPIQTACIDQVDMFRDKNNNNNKNNNIVNNGRQNVVEDEVIKPVLRNEKINDENKAPVVNNANDEGSSAVTEDVDMSDVATIRDAGRRRPNDRRKSIDYRAQPTEKISQIQLEVARKAKIPLFLKSPLFTTPEPPSPDTIGKTPTRHSQSRNINFDEVTLGRTIGEGAFGKVHEGKWRDRPVAVKLLICQDLHHDILEEFQSEVEIMSVLRHPNICRLLGACMDPPNRCLVVELLPRGSLWSVLRTSRSIDYDMRFSFINDTSKGMSYLHNFQPPILHRDLKSPNLLVDKNYAIKISDFGLSRVKAHVQTMTGNCGTVQWMAPEVLGNQKYTEKADVFSFGIVIWECVTGECPYDGMTQIQAALGVLNRNLRPVVPKSCPPFLAQLMKACWARQPELRPSFVQIVSALRDYSIRKNMDNASK